MAGSIHDPLQVMGTKRSEVPTEAPSLHRGLKPLALFGTMFFLACGGPYGGELLVPLAGPALAILSKLGMALLWGVPSALVTAELVSAMPQEGGAYQWYRAGLGPFWSFQLSWLDWLSWFFDSAIYPPLVAAYLVTFFVKEPSHLTTWIVCLIVIWACTGLNIRGVKEVGNFSVVLTVLVMLPVVAMVILGLPKITFSHVGQLIPEGHSPLSALRYALIWGIWSYSGYSGLAYAAEEIVDTERSYPKILAMFVPFTVLVYALPLLVGLGADPNWAQWKTAHFTVVGLLVGGPWLAACVSIGAMMASLALFNSELLIMSRLPYAMARDRLLPRTLTQLHPRYGTPHLTLIALGLVLSGLTYFWGFLDILVFSTWLAMPTYIMEFAIPIILRWKYPKLRGSFRVPGGWLGLLLIVFIPTLIALFVLFTATWEHVLLGSGFIAAGPLLYGSSRWWNQRSEAREAQPCVEPEG